MATQIPIYHSSGVDKIHGATDRLFANWLSPPSSKDILLPDDHEAQVDDWIVSSANSKRYPLAPKRLTEVSISRKFFQEILTERSKHSLFSRLEECYQTSVYWFFIGPNNEVKGPISAIEMDQLFESGFFEQTTLISNADSDKESFRYLTFWLKKYFIFHILQIKPAKKNRCSESSMLTQKTDLEDHQTLCSDRSIGTRNLEEAKVFRANELVFLNETCLRAASEDKEEDEEIITRERSHTLF